MKTPSFILLSLVFTASIFAELKIASPFGDHMVLQRGQPVPVWGSADSGESIEVIFGGQTLKTIADEEGSWRVQLKPMKASAVDGTMSISSSEQEIVFRDVLVGEVWLCGGQSNMERQLGPRQGQKDIIGWEEAVAAADFPLIRELHVERTMSLSPTEEVDAYWRVCSPESVVDFTAVGYFFARDVYQSLGVPVGIIHSSWGGTPAEAWTSFEGLSDFPAYIESAETNLKFEEDRDAARADYEEKLATWFEENDPARPDEIWKSPASEWKSMTLPNLWENVGYENVDGVCWFRKNIVLPNSLVDKELVLELGMIDDDDTTWFNGHLLGTTAGYRARREYVVPAEYVVDGENVITVRVLDTGGGGGIWGNPNSMRLSLKNGDSSSVKLAGEWESRFTVDLAESPRPPADVTSSSNAPTVLYNGMIAPLIPYAIRGVTFYQGEANAGRAKEYETLLPALISDWRELWGGDPFPFLFVQIAPYKGMPPEIREAQRLAQKSTKNTAMVVTIDVGDADDIHPANKEPVGRRLALAARALAYGEDIVYSGPEIRNWVQKRNKVRIRFTNTAGGMLAKGGELYGFELAGEDGVFHSATAKIKGDSVVLDAEDIAEVVSIRYAWADVADGNLYNDAGLPASPFIDSK